jgi:hypothetical protein
MLPSLQALQFQYIILILYNLDDYNIYIVSDLRGAVCTPGDIGTCEQRCLRTEEWVSD